MEGAIESGERSAREVLESMGKLEKGTVWQKEPENEVRKYIQVFYH